MELLPSSSVPLLFALICLNSSLQTFYGTGGAVDAFDLELFATALVIRDKKFFHLR